MSIATIEARVSGAALYGMRVETVESLTAAISTTPPGPHRDMLVRRRFAALAAKDQAWIAARSEA